MFFPTFLDGPTISYHLEKKTADDARAFCNGIGSNLYEPRNLSSNAFVTREAKAKGITQFWIGIRDVQTEDTFRYDSNGEQITWNNWKQGQPNNAGGGEDCTSVGVTKMATSNGNWNINIASSEAGLWWDQKCHFLKEFVCESSVKVVFIKNVFTWLFW